MKDIFSKNTKERIRELELKVKRLLVQRRAILGRESLASASTRKEKQPNTPIFNNNNKISFTTQLQTISKKYKKYYINSQTDQIDYIF